MAGDCHALTAPGSYWSFCPSLAAAIVLVICFGLTLIAHLVQGIYYRKAYTWVIVGSATLQTLAYAFRIVSIYIPDSLGDYAAWFVLILIAPLWTNAFVYMALGRMVWNFTSRAKVLGISAWWFGTIFVVLDIIAFIIQILGAALAVTSTRSHPDDVLGFLHLYMIGVGIQQFFILIFFIFGIGLHVRISREHALSPPTKRRALTLLYVLYACLILITIRIIFRLIEYSAGLHSTIPNHEVYQYCLDSLPMLLALVLLNIVHPARIMPGREADLPSRKSRKQGVRSRPDLWDGGAEEDGQEMVVGGQAPPEKVRKSGVRRSLE